MERKTKVHAEEGKQEIFITREFDLPLELLFKAYEEADIVEQWMGTKVVKLENKQHGGFEFETSDNKGNVVFRANGTIHQFVPNENIIRTFEIMGTPHGIQLEYLHFESISPEKSKLNMQIIYRSVKDRDALISIGVGMAIGIDMAHNRLEKVLSNLQ
ncbi:uncharacterized protein YndB with AHSA1/START domain [Chitinophaga skermanii]|uniref:Uncharacterized protein YndB with AHSA1/START domain n=1 Tax=Chitinophaga skermanii TaxID=331697 RepID=A0A327QWD2_9BACT|nr:SRPBCC domain-containing protein [Chitinophaga skermanii]RAJ08660.1 uncharacterized protein YndB with AHSA1/START domain [Chitinophaga skermanii]